MQIYKSVQRWTWKNCAVSISSAHTQDRNARENCRTEKLLMQELTTTDESCSVSAVWRLDLQPSVTRDHTLILGSGPIPRGVKDRWIMQNLVIWTQNTKGRKEKCWLIQDTANLTDPISWHGGLKPADFEPLTPIRSHALNVDIQPDKKTTKTPPQLSKDDEDKWSLFTITNMLYDHISQRSWHQGKLGSD